MKTKTLTMSFFLFLLFIVLGAASVYAYTNVSVGKPYEFSFPNAPSTAYPDSDFSELTDGVYGSGNYWDPAWQSRYFASPGSYYETINLKVPTTVHQLSLNFLKDDSAGIKYPESVRFYYSMDGKYFTLLGEGIAQTEVNSTKKYQLTLDADVTALFVRAYVKTVTGNSFIDEFDVEGTANYPLPVKLSVGKSYTSSMAAHPNHPDTGNTELTDGIYASGNYTDPAWNARFMGTSISSYTQTLDLGSASNVSQVTMRFLGNLSAGIYLPGGVRLSYSTDNITFTDLNFMFTNNVVNRGAAGELIKIDLTLPYTVNARYIKAVVYGIGNIFGDEWEVYGQTTAIPAPSPTQTPTPTPGPFADKPEYTNIALGKTYTTTAIPHSSYPDTGGIELTDGKFGGGYTDNRWVGFNLPSNTSFDQTVDLGQSYSNVVGVAAEFAEDASAGVYYPQSVGVSISTDGTNFTYIGDAVRGLEVGKKSMYKFTFDNKTARYVKLHIYGSSLVFQNEIQVYAGEAHKAVLDGGFINLPIQSPSTVWYNVVGQSYSEELWKKEVQAMKNLGMRYIIIGHSADTDQKLTVYPTQISGYSQVTGPIYGYTVSDPIETVMAEADALGMKVLIGTGITYDWYQNIGTTETEKNAWIDANVIEQNKIIQELYDKYSSHSSFHGFYLALETCDDWLKNGEWAFSRRLYKGSSDFIRTLSPDAKVAIAPAVWETTAPATFANDLRSMLYNDGNRPVADIVITQDGIGVGHTGTPPVYFTFEERLQTISYTLRSIGVQYWNDTEFFELPYYNSKRVESYAQSLTQSSKYTNINVVYDITDYFNVEKKNMDATQTYADYVMYYNEEIKDKGFVNLALNKTYTGSMAADVNYPDTGGAELTDGSFGLPTYTASQWQGRYDASPFNYSFTVDLGSNDTVNRFDSQFLKYTTSGINAPTSVSYAYSTDNINFTPAGTVNDPGVPDTYFANYRLTLSSGVTARYLKITINSPVGWSMMSEFSILK